MAQTGYTPISIYYSSTAGNTPTAGNLVAGELAINTADGKLFYKDSAGVVQVIAGKGGSGIAAGSNRQIQFNSSGSLGAAANFSYDTNGNLLLGTTTSPTTTGLGGSMSIAGYGIYPIVTSNGTVNTSGYLGLAIQNPTFNSTGAGAIVLIGSQMAPQASHDATAGTNSLTIRSLNLNPSLVSSASTSVVSLVGLNINAQRNYAADISSAAGNSSFGISASAGNASTLSTSATTQTVAGISSTASVSAGTATNMYAFLGSNNLAPTAGSVSTTNAYGLNVGASIGTSAGTATVSNYYGILINTPNVGANGTVTTRYGIAQNDTASINYFAGNTGFGITTPVTSGRVAIACTGTTRNTGLAITPSGDWTDGLRLYCDNTNNPNGIIENVWDSTGTTLFRDILINPSGGNILLGTSTLPTSGSGAMNIGGYANMVYTSGGTSVTTNNFSELLQNTTVLNTTGAASQNLTGLGCFPQGSHDATGGTNTLALNACSFQPNLTSTAATSTITLRGAFFGSVRNYAADTSSSSSNQLFGLQTSFGHATTLSTSASTTNAAGVLSSGTMAAGSITDFAAFRAQLPINPTSGTVTVTSRYGFYDTGASIGASGGTANVTNYYGMLLSGTTVGATGTVTNYYGINITAPTVTGTVTNRFGIYQSDTAGTNLLAAPTKITNGYTVATLPTGAAAAVGMRAYVTDALAPVFLGTLTGGGTVVTPVFHNGTAWVAG